MPAGAPVGDEAGRFVGGSHGQILAHGRLVGRALALAAGTNSVGPVTAFLNWWDGNELWLSGLPFVLQAMVVMPIVLAVAYLTALVLDGLLGKGIGVMRRLRRTDGSPR